jgi:hypothetical protein
MRQFISWRRASGANAAFELAPLQPEAIALDDQSHEERGMRRLTDVLVGTQDIAVVLGDEDRRML